MKKILQIALLVLMLAALLLCVLRRAQRGTPAVREPGVCR